MFQAIIESIGSDIPTVENVILAATDGIVVARRKRLPGDDVVTVEAANLVRECLQFSSELKAGPLEHMVFHFKDRILAVQMVNEEYFLLGLATEPRRLGKLKYQLKLKAYECYSAIV